MDYSMRQLESQSKQSQSLSCMRIAPNLFGEMIIENHLLKSFKESAMICGGNYYVLPTLDYHTKEKELMSYVGNLVATPIASDSFALKNFSITTQSKTHKDHQKRLYPFVASIADNNPQEIMSLIVSIYEELMGFPQCYTELKH